MFDLLYLKETEADAAEKWMMTEQPATITHKESTAIPAVPNYDINDDLGPHLLLPLHNQDSDLVGLEIVSIETGTTISPLREAKKYNSRKRKLHDVLVFVSKLQVGEGNNATIIACACYLPAVSS